MRSNKEIKKYLLKSRKKLDKYLNKKISCAIKGVKKNYLKEMNKVNCLFYDNNLTEEETNSRVINYSTIDLDILGKYLAEIMSLFEGKKYV